jgi:hypothetical protein
MQEDLFGVEPTRALLDTLLTSSRLYRTTADYNGQVETLLGLGAQSRFTKR